MASERGGLSFCRAAQATILAIVSAGKRVDADGSCPVAGRPRAFLCADIAFFIIYEYTKCEPRGSTNFRPGSNPQHERLGIMSKADPRSTPIRSRRAVLAGIASAAALPIVAAVPTAAQNLDAELIELGARLEPLVEQYYSARKRWAPLMVAAHAERDRKFGHLAEYSAERMAALSDCCKRLGDDEANDALHAVYEDMEPLMKAINAAQVNSVEGLRAKALVAFYEIAPLGAGDTEFSFEDAYPFQQLFTAVADLCGLKGKIAATGFELPDVSDDADDEGEEA